MFFLGLTILSNFTNALSATPLNAIPLNCISMKNQERKIRPEIINIINPIFYPFSIKIINVVVIVIILIIHMQKFVFLML